jgi:hypothetical protein
MVLGDATLHQMVDHSNCPNQCSRAMPNRYAVSTVLQFQSRLLQVTGITCRTSYWLKSPKLTIFLVLASPHIFPLLRPTVAGPGVPRLFLATIFTATRGIIRAIAGTFFLVITLCHDQPDMSISSGINAIPWTSTVLNTRLHMVAAQPRYSIELPGSAGFHGAVLAMGVNGLQSSATWYDSKRRDHGRCYRARVVLLLGCVSPTA